MSAGDRRDGEEASESESESEITDAISATMLRLRVRAPFFATLCLFARFLSDRTIPTACTDGKDIYFNPAFFARLSPFQLDWAILHEVLHAALLHVSRRGERDPVRWNIAADVVVNGILAREARLEPAPGAIREPRLEHLPVEEIYDLLERDQLPVCPDCLRRMDRDGRPGWRSQLHEIESYWRDALHKAESLVSQGQGTAPAGLLRRLRRVTAPQIDWRTALWRFMVRTPVDFIGYDRRFLHTGLYLDALDGERVRAYVAVDTSGSISDALLATFLAEVNAILRTYPAMAMTLYYCDAALDGPHELNSGDIPPMPVGGGGTSFVPLFDAVAEQRQGLEETPCVYLTDGYGTFPRSPPPVPVLWVVTPGGLDSDTFPFGQVIRLRDL